MVVRVIVLLAAALGLARAEAAAPRETAAFGLALDATPQSVAAVLAAPDPGGRGSRSLYPAPSGTPQKQTAALAINPGLASNDPATLSTCTVSPRATALPTRSTRVFHTRKSTANSRCIRSR